MFVFPFLILSIITCLLKFLHDVGVVSFEASVCCVSQESRLCQVISANCMSLQNAHAIYNKVLGDLKGRSLCLPARQAARQLETCLSTSKCMVYVYLASYMVVMFIYIQVHGVCISCIVYGSHVYLHPSPWCMYLLHRIW